MPCKVSAPVSEMTRRELTLSATLKQIRFPILSLISLVMMSAAGRCVAMTRCMPAYRAFAASVLMNPSSLFLVSLPIDSAL